MSLLLLFNQPLEIPPPPPAPAAIAYTRGVTDVAALAGRVLAVEDRSAAPTHAKVAGRKVRLQ